MTKDEIVIFFNERDDKVYVKVQEGVETSYELQNLAGKVLQEATHKKALHDFDITGFNDGIYFVIIRQGDQIRSKKIIKGYHP